MSCGKLYKVCFQYQSIHNIENMYALLFTLTIPLVSYCVTIRYSEHPDIVSKSRVELSPILISCGLNDIVIISAPVVNKREAVYYLHKPNGDVLHLDIPRPERQAKNKENYNEIVVNYIKEDVKVLSTVNNYIVFGVNYETEGDIYGTKERHMNSNDFIIGPVLEEDHGNSVLSVYYKDLDEDWIELFQVITIEIIELVPMSPLQPTLRVGDTLELSFAYPIKHMQSCELIAPTSTFDRFFDRNRTEPEKCGFVIRNVTQEDEGLWTIIGVGKIVYDAVTYLHVNKIT